ncbi:hypothetical protein ACS0TY_014713 [Phlomoides rotata]
MVVSCRKDILAFDEFIRNSGLVDLPMHDRLYTWYKPDGSCKSRLDRILVLQCLALISGIQRVVTEKWRSYEVEGWGGFVLKEKLKRLKTDIKQWNKEVFKQVDEKIEDRRNKIQELDMIDEAMGLVQNEIIQRNEERAGLLYDIKCRDNILQQKARCKWIKEGDANTRYFHKCINKRRKRNEISGVNIGSVWREEVQEVKKGIFDFFNTHFSRSSGPRPILDSGLFEKKISTEDNAMLTTTFSIEEVKAAVFECDSSESPGPDDFNFGFLKQFWELLEEEIMKMVQDFHSFGKITLINAVLSSLSVYFFSTYRAPKTTVRDIVKLQRSFLWGGGGECEKKISWVKWNNICKSKALGGLDVKDLTCFNLTLLGKWVWRFLREGDSLWARVVRPRWGKLWGSFERRGMRGRGIKLGGWWGEILKAIGEHNGWFCGGLERVVGSGEDTGFWDDVWIEGGDPVSSFGRWGENGWSWEWRWRRGLFDRELPMLDELLSVVNRYTPNQGVKDTWKWNRAPNGVYSTKTAYEWIMRSKEGEAQQELEEFKLIWNSFSPSKVRMHAWRILWDRIPTTTKLIRRNAISPNTSTTCTFCKQETETVHHLFFECSSLGGRKGKQISVSIWQCLVWILWKVRNAFVFRNEEFVADNIVMELKTRTWSWFRAREVLMKFSAFEQWERNPRLVLNI